MLLLIVLLAGGVSDGFRIELLGGGARSFDTKLTVSQADATPVTIDARWAGRSLEGPLYYALRLSRWSGEQGWGLSLVHHKLYLENPTAEVSDFSVSHGYNLLSLERSWLVRGFTLGVGAGIVIAHPESTVRGRTWPQEGGLFGGGYHVAGPSLAIAAGRRLPLFSRLELTLEGRFTASWARVPVAEGEANVPDRSLHLLVGLGWRFAR